MDEPLGSRKNMQKGKEKIKCSYCGRGFHPESSCMKRTNYQRALLLEKNNITLPEGVRKKDNQDRNNQPERGHALMANVLNPRALLIDSGASNHMVACKDSFSSLDFDSCISINMGDDSKISSQGRCTIHLEHDSFKNVLYVPYLASNILSVYQITHIGLQKRVVFIPNEVDISKIVSRKVIATGIANHFAKSYELSKFVPNSKPSALLTHGNEVN